MEEFHLTHFKKCTAPETLKLFSQEEAANVRAFHQMLPGYAPTPLIALSSMAGVLGLDAVWVKDESHRFGLNAFKALGASYAVSRLSERPRGLITATDGNHGRGVAWTARQIGVPCRVYLPRGSAPERVANIQKEGAQALVTDRNYDDTVRLARRAAQELGWTVVQDTAWDGYFDLPIDIMRGYMTMAMEAAEQLAPQTPTHIFLQAGVGSMAGAVAAYWKNRLGEGTPVIVVVEPNGFDCHYRSACADEIRFSPPDGETIMAGLACGEPNPISWSLLRHCAQFAAACPDFAAADGMRALSSPVAGDPRIVSGESGAAAFGFLFEVMTLPELSAMRTDIGLDKTSRVLLFSTEGATDLENYRDVVWRGRFSAPEEKA